MKILLAAIFIGFFFPGLSQKKYLPGYVVNSNKDTLRGYLQNDVEEKLTNGIFFSQNTDGFKLHTQPEIISFGFDDGSVFRIINYTNSVEQNQKQIHFAKLILDGTNDVFSFIKKDKLFFLINAKNDSTYFIYDDFRTPTGEINEKGNYQAILYFLGFYCGNTNSNIERLRYSESTILSYFLELEKCNGNDIRAKVFYTKPKAEMRLYAFAGGMAIRDDYQISANIIFRFFFSSQSKKTSLNTGFSYYHSSRAGTYPSFYNFPIDYTAITTLYEIPFTMQYDFLTGAVRPYVTAGFGVAYVNATPFPPATNYKVEPPRGAFGFTFIGGAGLEVNVLKQLMVKIDWRYNFSIQLPTIGIAFRIK